MAGIFVSKDFVAPCALLSLLVGVGCASVGVPHDGNGMTDPALPIASGSSTTPVPADAASAAAPPAASAVPSTNPSAIASTTPPASDSASPIAAGKPVRVTVGDPKFEGGDVPKAKAALDRLAKSITKCVNEHGGLHTTAGSIDIKFLVRAEGIAEGVDVESAKGIDTDAKKCVRDAFKKKTMGPPSSDPVGVTVKIELELRGDATP